MISLDYKMSLTVFNKLEWPLYMLKIVGNEVEGDLFFSNSWTNFAYSINHDYT